MTSQQFERIKEVLRDVHIDDGTMKAVRRELKYKWSIRTIERVSKARSLKAYGLACRHVVKCNY